MDSGVELLWVREGFDKIHQTPGSPAFLFLPPRYRPVPVCISFSVAVCVKTQEDKAIADSVLELVHVLGDQS